MMKINLKNPLIVFGLCVAVTFVCAGGAARLQSGFGGIIVETGFLTPEHSDAANGLPVRIAYKLYKPKEASAANPVPAVLAMHGYQNDKETSSAFCIELARRGIAVLAIDPLRPRRYQPRYARTGLG